MVEELNPCPFCGGEPKLYTLEKQALACVRCGECGCQTALLFSPVEAITAWNARPDNAGVLNELVEAVKALCVDADYMDRTALDFEAVEDALAKLDAKP